jgi:hypothetical protein
LLYLNQAEDPVSEMPLDGYAAFKDTWLTCNTLYSYRIRAFDSLGDSAFSDVITYTTPMTDTFEPDDDYLQAHTIYVNMLNSSTQNHNLGFGLDMDWFKLTASTGEVYSITTSQFTHSDSYTPTLALFDDPTSGPLTTTQHCGSDLRSLCINGWSPGSDGDYYLRVSGQGGCPGHDYFLNVVDSHLSDSWPAPPTAFTGTVTLPDQIDLTWADNSTGELGYRLERHLGVAWLLEADLGYGVTSYQDSGLPCGQPYEYRVYAFNESGNSTPATVELSTPACVYPIQWNLLNLPIIMR